jgi:hypothetical protein
MTSPSSPHKLLDAYVQAYTTFTPIDGDHALLAAEPDVQTPKVQVFPWEKLTRGPSLQCRVSVNVG